MQSSAPFVPSLAGRHEPDGRLQPADPGGAAWGGWRASRLPLNVFCPFRRLEAMAQEGWEADAFAWFVPRLRFASDFTASFVCRWRW